MSIALVIPHFRQAEGNLRFSVAGPKGLPELRVVYLSYGEGHGIATIGTRKQTIWDRCRWYVSRIFGISFQGGTTSTLSVGFSGEDSGLAIFVSMEGFQEPLDPLKDLSIQFIDESGITHPMLFSEGVSSLDKRTHFAAWGLPLTTPPRAGSRIMIVDSGSGKLLAQVTELRTR